MSRPFPAVLLILSSVTAVFPSGCENLKHSTASAPAAATDSAWEWVRVPQEHQCSYGTGVAAASQSIVAVGFFDRGFSGDCSDIRYGDSLLELREEMNLFVARHDTDGSVTWVRRYGDGGRLAPAGVAIAPNGSIYVAATLTPNIRRPGPGRWDTGAGVVVAATETAILARLDASGMVLWARTIDGVADVSDVAVGDDVVYVAGSTLPQVRASAAGGPELPDSSDAYVAAYSSDGIRRWFQIVARGGYAEANSISATSYGICVAGSFSVPDILVHEGEERRFGVGHGFAAGFSHRGRRLWMDTVAPRPRDSARTERSTANGPQSISVLFQTTAADPRDACYVAGAFAGRLQFGRDTLMSMPHSPSDAPPRGYTDVVVMKYDRNGGLQWARRGIGGPVSDHAEALAVTPDERVIVTGTFMGAGDFAGIPLALPEREPSTESRRWVGSPRGVFVAALSGEGDVLHVVQNVPQENARPTGLAVLPDGGIYLTGEQQRGARYGPIEAKTAGDNAFLARLTLRRQVRP